MSTKHTPGPWRAEQPSDDFGHTPLFIYADESTVIARTFGNPLSKGNARLIAAAPEMREVLELVMQPAINHSERLAACRELAFPILARIDGEDT